MEAPQTSSSQEHDASPVRHQKRRGSKGRDQLHADHRRGDLTYRAAWFVALNGLVLGAIAIFHPYSAAADMQQQLDLRGYVCLVGIECFLLMTPAIACLWLLHGASPRWAQRSAVAWALGVSAVYLIDLMLLVTIHEHFFSLVTFRLAQSILPFLWSYLPAHDIAIGSAAIAGWIIGQCVIWFAAGKLGSRLRPTESASGPPNWRFISAACCLGALTLAWFVSPVFTATKLTLQEIRRESDRHPITVTGWFQANITPEYRPDSLASVRGAALLVANDGQIEQRLREYKQLAAARRDVPGAEPSKLHDVVVIVTECLRPETINAKTAPHVYSLAQEGLTLNNHYSAGNMSNLGFFGLMTGLDAVWIHQAQHLPNGLFDSLKQVGYETGFFGRDDFNKFGMERFCGPDRFDVSEYVTIEDAVACDQEVCRLAADFLDRDDRYPSRSANPTQPAESTDDSSTDASSDTRAPRIALVYLYASHYPYSSEPVDRIHHPSDLADVSLEVQSRSESTVVEYLNSIHFVDRTIAPLLDPNRITFVLGDHGESFGEDDRIMHGSALSRIQLQVACVGFGPGIPVEQIDAATSHVDLFPTIADALDVRLKNSSLMAGSSLLEPLRADDVLACCSSSSDVAFVRRDRNMKADKAGSDAADQHVAESFAYQGFVSFPAFTLSPGGPIDKNGSSIPSIDSNADSSQNAADEAWDNAGPMRHWLARTLGQSFADIPVDAAPLIRNAFRSDKARVRLEAIELCGKMGQRSKEFLPDLEALLTDADEHVKAAAFQAVHRIHR